MSTIDKPNLEEVRILDLPYSLTLLIDLLIPSN